MICQIASNRLQTLRVKLPGVVSSSGEVIAGVPQGGVISPALFNVFVNDVDDCCPPGVSAPVISLMTAASMSQCLAVVIVTCK